MNRNVIVSEVSYEYLGKFINMDNDEVKKALFHLVDFVEDTLDEIEVDVYEELTDWCITYCQIKYKSSHPLNRFFDM